MNSTEPRLGTHVDDIFGGFQFCNSYDRALHFRNYLCSTGEKLTISFNMKINKTPLPARQQVILGCLWDSVERRVRTAEKKRKKYRRKIASFLSKSTTTTEDILKLHGSLNYAAQVAPFGRPFLAPLTNLTTYKEPRDKVVIDDLTRKGLGIWEKILRVNRGISFDFVLSKLPRCQ